jgi:PilZ domain-containing protein
MIADRFVIGRRDKRVAASTLVTLIVGSEGKKVWSPAHVIEISERGARVKVEVEVRLGQIVEVLQSEGPQHPSRARVAWVGKEEPGHQAAAGLEFESPVTCASSILISARK